MESDIVTNLETHGEALTFLCSISQEGLRTHGVPLREVPSPNVMCIRETGRCTSHNIVHMHNQHLLSIKACS